MGKRLSDTEALASRGINRPGPKVASFGGNLAVERGADNAVASRPSAGAFRKETSAGGEGLSGAMECLKKGC